MDITSIYYLTLEDNIPFYVGKTHTTLKRRLYTHWRMSNNKNIQIHSIDEIPTNEWKFWECYWIEQFKIWGFDLKNKNNGGGGSTKWTQEQKNNPLRKKRLSQSLKGKILGVEGYWRNKTHTKETKQKMSMAHKDIPLSKEHKQAISKAMIGHSKTEEWKKNLSKSSTESFGRKVIQQDLEGNIIKEWDSGKQAAQELGLNYTAINNCCRFNDKGDKRKRDKDKLGKYTSYSYIWEYKI
jgi:hypothetical protein